MTTTPTAEPPRFTLVAAPACHFCDDAHSVLEGLAGRGIIRLEVLPAESEEGARLVGEHRPSMYPLILLDGAYFGAGRLKRPRLERILGLPRGAA